MLGMDVKTAENYISLSKLSGSVTVTELQLPLRSLYLLAALSTPDHARQQVIDCAKAGEPMNS
jgi:hypothetical protein